MDNSRNRPIIFRGKSVVTTRDSESELFIAMVGDNDSNTITFKFDRYYNGIDLSIYSVQLHIDGDIISGGENIVTQSTGLTKTIGTGDITVAWLVADENTYATGTADAQFKFTSEAGAIWRTDIFGIKVDQSVDVETTAITLYPNILTDHESRILKLEGDVEDVVADAETALANANAAIATADASNETVTGLIESNEALIEDVNEAIQNANDAANAAAEMEVVADIAARNALVGKKFCMVLDATADETVASGGATYAYNGTAWVKTSENESLDLVLTAENTTVEATPTNYTAASGNVEAHLAGIDTALGDKLDAPTSAGTDGQVLTSDGAGGQAWETLSSVNPTVITLSYQGADGGNSTSTINGQLSFAIGTLPTPTKTGYTFLGWFTASSGGTEVTSATEVATVTDYTIYAQWELAPTEGLLYEYVSASGYQVSAGTVTTGAVKIAATYNDGTHGELPVFQIKSNGFLDKTGITSVIMPNSITSIVAGTTYPSGAFARCTGLTSVTFSTALTEIPARTFDSCTALTSISIPSNVTTIGRKAFDCCGLTSLILHGAISSIGEDAFSGNLNLATVAVLRTTPCSMGSGVFTNAGSSVGGCVITVPNGTGDTYKAASGWSTYAANIVEAAAPVVDITSANIKDHAIIGITLNGTAQTPTDGTVALTVLTEETYSNEYDRKKADPANFKLSIYMAAAGAFTMPFAASATNTVVNVYWGDTNSDLNYSTSSGNRAHNYAASGFYTIVVEFVSGSGGLNLEGFGSQYVDNATIIKAEFPTRGVLVDRSMLFGTFRRCIALREVTGLIIPYEGDSNKYLFENCTALTRFIGSGYARTDGFSGCTALREVELNPCLNVADRAFYNCTALRSITLNSSSNGGYSDGSSNCFGNVSAYCFFSGTRAANLYALVTATNGTLLNPNGVDPVAKVTTGSKVQLYGVNASNAQTMYDVETTLTDSDTKIPTSGAVADYAVAKVATGSLRRVYGVSAANAEESTEIETTPTASSTKLVTSGGVKTYTDNAIAGATIPSSSAVVVMQSDQTYIKYAASKETTYNAYVAGTTYAADDLVSYDGVVYKALRETIGDQPDESASDWEAQALGERLHFAKGASDKTITINHGDGTTAKSITIPSGSGQYISYHYFTTAGNYLIAIIGECYGAYVNNDTAGTPDAKNKYLEAYLGSNFPVGDNSFYGCANLSKIEFSETWAYTSLGASAFRTCGKLKNITVPDTVTTIGTYVFYSCTNLTNIKLAAVTAISNYAFGGCESLISIILNTALTSIGEFAFYLSGLTSFKVGNLVTSIGENAFRQCNSLLVIEFKTSTLPTFGNDVFSGDRISDIIATSSGNADSIATAVTSGEGTLLTNYRKLY